MHDDLGQAVGALPGPKTALGGVCRTDKWQTMVLGDTLHLPVRTFLMAQGEPCSGPMERCAPKGKH